MITWVLVGLLVLGAIIFIKISHYRHKIFVFLVIILALFLYVSIAYVASKNNLDFSSVDGASKSVKIYGGWLFNVFGNFKSLTGNAIKLDWTATNSSFSLNDNSSKNTKTSPITGRATARFAK